MDDGSGSSSVVPLRPGYTREEVVLSEHDGNLKCL